MQRALAVPSPYGPAADRWETARPGGLSRPGPISGRRLPAKEGSALEGAGPVFEAAAATALRVHDATGAAAPATLVEAGAVLAALDRAADETAAATQGIVVLTGAAGVDALRRWSALVVRQAGAGAAGEAGTVRATDQAVITGAKVPVLQPQP